MSGVGFCLPKGRRGGSTFDIHLANLNQTAFGDGFSGSNPVQQGAHTELLA